MLRALLVPLGHFGTKNLTIKEFHRILRTDLQTLLGPLIGASAETSGCSAPGTHSVWWASRNPGAEAADFVTG